MPDALWFTDDEQACRLLADDPFALLVGFAIDQQVPVQKAFAGPYVLKQRAGTLDPKKLASPWALVGWIPRMNVLLAAPAPNPE